MLPHMVQNTEVPINYQGRKQYNNENINSNFRELKGHFII